MEMNMARYIDADAFKEYLRKGTEANADIIPQRLVDTVLDIMDGIMLDIDEQPTVDAVPVVRCKDCRWWDKEREQCGITPSASPYGHCHDGETLEHSMIKDAGR